MDMACDDHESVLVTRRSGRDVVIISKEDYDSMMETLYLMSSKENHRRIVEAMNRKGGKSYKNVDELRKKYKMEKK